MKRLQPATSEPQLNSADVGLCLQVLSALGRGPIPESGHDQQRHDRNDENSSRRCPQGDISFTVGPVGYWAIVDAKASHIGR